MTNPACSIRAAQDQVANDAAEPILGPFGSAAPSSPFDGLPRWPEAAQAMLPGAHHARADDDDEDDDGKFSDKPRAGSKKGRDDDDGDDDDRPRPRKTSSSGAGAAAAGAGIGIGMILLIVVGVGACCLCVPGILIALLLPAVQKVRDAAANAQTINNARQIALGCHQYHDQNKSLPSPRMQPQPPQNISPELSWRVTVLPMVEQQGLFLQFDTNQGWDGPKNGPLKDRMPMIFGSPVNPAGNTSQTKFQYFTGPATLFPDPLQKVSLGTIKDGTSNTFLFAEGATPVPWSKPADMVVGNGPLPLPEGKFIAAMADATVRVVQRRSAGDDVLRMVIDPNDGKPLPPGWGE